MGSSSRGGSSFGSRGGFGGSSRRSSFGGGGFRPSVPPPPRFGGFRPPPPRRRYYGGGGGGCGCGSVLAVAIVVGIIFLFIMVKMSSSGSDTSGITKSTVHREPLSASAATVNGYYTDELNWIKNPTKLNAGLKKFHKETGVAPYLYITDTVNGKKEPTADDMDAYANELYDKLFKDEAHILILFHEHTPSVYSQWYVCGKQAKTVMDGEACDILLDYISHYYYSDLEDSEMFATAFSKAADRIMSVEKSPWPIVLIVALVVVAIIIAFVWWRKAKAQKNLEAEQTERILKTDLNTLGSQKDDLSDIEDKYK